MTKNMPIEVVHAKQQLESELCGTMGLEIINDAKKRFPEWFDGYTVKDNITDNLNDDGKE